MATANDILKIAQAEVGTKATNIKKCKYNDWFYGGSVSGSAYDWCAVFVCWVFNKAGAYGLIHGSDAGLANCGYFANAFKKNGELIYNTNYSALKTSKVKAGDVVFFHWSNEKSTYCPGVYTCDHVGIIAAVNSDGTITTIEGNTGSTSNGEVMKRVRSMSVVSCVGRPKYAAAAQTTTTTTNSTSTVINFAGKKGVDISTWQGDINLSKVKKAGYDFVMIRCGWGCDSTKQDDNRFVENVKKAQSIGMPWGVYLFSYACSTADAKSEVAHVDRLLKAEAKKGYRPTFPIAIDIEWTAEIAEKGGWNSKNLTNVTTVFLDEIKKLGYYPMIYTGGSELKMMNDHVRNDFDCWFAQWYTSPTDYKYNRLGIWQYGGETNYIDGATISGVSGKIDKDKSYKDYPTIIKNGKYNSWNTASSDVVVPATTNTTNTTNTSGTPITTTVQPSDAKVTETGKPKVLYRVRSGGTWHKEVNDLVSYAGIDNIAITDIAIKVTKGKVKYRVHVKGGGWLPYVTGYNINDYKNGYAGNGKPIDAIEIYYTTPSDVKKSLGYPLKAKYHVSPVNNNKCYDWQYDDEKTNGQDGYAGVFGKAIDRIQITLSK